MLWAFGGDGPYRSGHEASSLDDGESTRRVLDVAISPRHAGHAARAADELIVLPPLLLSRDRYRRVPNEPCRVGRPRVAIPLEAEPPPGGAAESSLASRRTRRRSKRCAGTIRRITTKSRYLTTESVHDTVAGEGSQLWNMSVPGVSGVEGKPTSPSASSPRWHSSGRSSCPACNPALQPPARTMENRTRTCRPPSGRIVMS